MFVFLSVINHLESGISNLESAEIATGFVSQSRVVCGASSRIATGFVSQSRLGCGAPSQIQQIPDSRFQMTDSRSNGTERGPIGLKSSCLFSYQSSTIWNLESGISNLESAEIATGFVSQCVVVHGGPLELPPATGSREGARARYHHRVGRTDDPSPRPEEEDGDDLPTSGLAVLCATGSAD